jgi:hypothetical protein
MLALARPKPFDGPMRPHHTPLATLGVIAVATTLLGCPAAQNTPDAGRRESKLVTGVKAVTAPAVERLPDGGVVAVYVASGGVELWAVERRGMQEVLGAVKHGSGTELAAVLEKRPAASPELVARAKAVKGREPVGEQAEAALTGPLSLPFGGLHSPVHLAQAGLETGTPEDCKDTLLRPGAVGQTLAGVGRTRVVMLLDGDELARFSACLDRATPAPDAPPQATAERARLRALLEQGRKAEVAVLMALGAD